MESRAIESVPIPFPVMAVRRGYPTDEFGMKAEEIRRGKNMIRGDVQAMVSSFAIKKLGYKGAELGKRFHLRLFGINIASKRGEEIG